MAKTKGSTKAGKAASAKTTVPVKSKIEGAVKKPAKTTAAKNFAIDLQQVRGMSRLLSIWSHAAVSCRC